jgi:hypothetical protein
MKHDQIVRILVVCFAFSTLALPALGQRTVRTPAHGVPGTLDPKTGVFTAFAPAVAQDAETAGLTATTFTGKLVLNIAITISSALPTTDTISCEGNATVVDNAVGGGNFLFETGAINATRTGSTATCTVTIPYSWPLVTASSDMMTLTYTVTSNPAVSPWRNSSQGLGTFKIPASGTTTTLAVKSTI